MLINHQYRREMVSEHHAKVPGCLSEAGIALNDGLRGNESQEEVGNRVHVEKP